MTTGGREPRTLQETVDRLCAASRRNYQNPYETIAWPTALERDQWFTSPELLSIYGTHVWDELDDGQRRAVSFWEAVNFYSLNIHGEKTLIEGLAARLYRKELAEVTPYLHHMLDEENKHSVYFGGFCNRYGGKVYPSRKFAVAREYAAGEETFLFFAMTLVFEETVDRFNVIMGKDERLAPIARDINSSHHADEARHLIFGRRMVSELWNRNAPGWAPEVVERVRHHIAGYFTAMWRDYYNPDVYRDAGLAEPRRLPEQLWSEPAQVEHRKAMSDRAVELLSAAGVLESEPPL